MISVHYMDIGACGVSPQEIFSNVKKIGKKKKIEIDGENKE